MQDSSRAVSSDATCPAGVPATGMQVRELFTAI